MELNDKGFLGACLEDCVHVAGILNFFQITEDLGFKTKFLGSAIKIPTIIKAIKNSQAKNIAISYRLTPKTGKQHIIKFIEWVKKENLTDRTYFLGGLPDLIQYAKGLNFFKAYFIGGETFDKIISILRGYEDNIYDIKHYPSNLLGRIQSKFPYPVLRAHFGVPSLKDMENGIEEIAKAKVLDIISIAPDQACQEYFHHPEKIKLLLKGAGGVPIRKKQDLIDLYKKSQIGNYPLLRIYSGTQDLIKNAELFQETIHNAWAAIPVFWYSQLDGRGHNDLTNAIQEHFNAINWYVDRDIPVEINDPHQWGLRMAPDHIVVADAYISAYIAKKLGVKTYIEQFMFNTPVGNTLKMDLARVLAMIEIVDPLIDKEFNVLRETRAGLAYFTQNEEIAKGQLCASTMLQMSIRPHIMHVVSYCEATRTASPKDIIESCQMIKRIIQDSINGLPNFENDEQIQERKIEILNDAQVLLNYLTQWGISLGYKDPLLSPKFLTLAVQKGVLDAPQLRGNKWALGKIKVRIEDGKCIVVNNNNIPISEKERIEQLDLKFSSEKYSRSEILPIKQE